MSTLTLALVICLAVYLSVLRRIWLKPDSPFTESTTFFVLLAGSAAVAAVILIVMAMPTLSAMSPAIGALLGLALGVGFVVLLGVGTNLTARSGRRHKKIRQGKGAQ